MISKIITKTITPPILLLLCIVNFCSCSNQLPETTASISFTLSSDFVEKITNAASEPGTLSRSVSSDGSSQTDYLMDISMKGDFEEMATVYVKAGSKVTFSNVTIGSSVYITGYVYELSEDSDGIKKRTDLFSGSSENLVVKSGENKISLPLKKVKSEAGQGQDQGQGQGQGQTLEGTATKYTVREWWQLTEGEGYSLHDSYEVDADSGSKTQATAKTYTGFTVQSPIEQQTIAADGTTIVNIYYDRLTYTVTYVCGNHTSENIPESKTVRYGAKAPTVFDTSDVLGYVFAGWFTDANCTVIYNSVSEVKQDLTLYAKWIEAGISGIAVMFDYSSTDFSLTRTETSDAIIFTAPESPSGSYSYQWLIDGYEIGSESSLTIDKADLIAGEPYDLVLYLTDSNGTYSAFVQIIKE